MGVAGSNKKIIIRVEDEIKENNNQEISFERSESSNVPNGNEENGLKIAYKGSFLDGLRDGYGIGYYSNGTYEGDWERGKKQGYGKYAFKNGDVYIGQFQDDKIEGNGSFTFRHPGKKFSNMTGVFNLGSPEDLDLNGSFFQNH